jgi:GxxExxY protein
MSVPAAQIRDPQTYAIIGAAMEVHAHLGCGFLEIVYRDALEIELLSRNIPCPREIEISVFYQGQKLQHEYRADFICFNEIIVEIKAIKTINPIERAQLLNYLKATGYHSGLLLNFDATSLE